MNALVPAEIEIDETTIKALVHAQFGLHVTRIAKMGEGFDNVVFLINDTWAFRFPRRKEAVALIEHEILALPLLVGKLTVDIPEPIYIGVPSSMFDYPFYGYRWVARTIGMPRSFECS